MSDRIEGLVARLHGLHPRMIDLSLGRLNVLLDKLGHPELHLPPVIHVAGTNGKGSVCANLRAIAQAAGWRAHVYTSPHLVRFTERIVIAGEEISEDALAAALAEVEAVNDGAAITVFELLTACAFMLFARHPAQIAIIEVGLGGRYDATNVIARPAASAITSISIDHREFLGEDLATIAGEKAGIIKAGAPAVSGAQAGAAMAVLRAEARLVGTRLLVRGADWEASARPGGMVFEDAGGRIELPAPALAGAHQIENAGIAIAAMRAGMDIPLAALGGIANAVWPARMQRLGGRLAALLPAGWELWLDGGHNPGAAAILAEHLRGWAGRPVHLIVGMKRSKDVVDFLAPLLDLADSITAVAEPGQHDALPVEQIVLASGGRARAAADVASALARLDGPPARVLICGSLYLAGVLLRDET
jgi:dihydrofolate synthase / folylpolyglutamate synthase